MTPSEREMVVAALDALGEHALAAELASASTVDALVDALLQASDLLRQSEAPELAALGSRCCRLGARLAAEDARC